MSRAAIVPDRSALSSFSQARVTQSQTASSPRTSNDPRRPVAGTPAACNIQRMLRLVAQASSAASGGSKGTARSSARMPSRWACMASKRLMSRSNSLSRTVPSVVALSSAA